MTRIRSSVMDVSRLLVVSFAALWLVGCGEIETAPSAHGPTEYPYRITTTVGMVTDIVRQVAGEQAVVRGIVGEGVDPHLYKPTRDDVAALQQADIIFYAGLMLEGKLGDALIRVGRTRPVYAVTELIDEQYLLEPEEFEGHWDPHVWMDLSAWAKCVEAVAGALGEFDPSHAEKYHSRAAAYVEQVMEMHEYGRRAIASIPEESRILITSHDAFNYFGRAYGIEVHGIQGISTDSEAGLADINMLVEYIVQRRVRAVFVETTVPQKNVRALIDGARARGWEVRIGGELFSDAMGAPGTYEGTYLGMMDHNITVVTRALGGDAPPRGLHGRLSREY